MKHIVSISGGIGSYFALKRVLEQHDKEDVIPVFCDTMAESGDLYRFLEDIERRLNIHIHVLCDGRTPIELAFEQQFIFNSRVANCSKILKSRLFKSWLKENFKPDECILYLGIDWTETHRCGAIQKNYKPYQVKFPMCEKPYIDKPEMIELLNQDGIETPYLYTLGFGHNNCNGFCFKAGVGHYKRLLEKNRLFYLECENREQRLIQKIKESTGKEYAILKRKGQPCSLKELRLIVENEPQQLSLFECTEEGGCGCFVDED